MKSTTMKNMEHLTSDSDSEYDDISYDSTYKSEAVASEHAPLSVLENLKIKDSPFQMANSNRHRHRRHHNDISRKVKFESKNKTGRRVNEINNLDGKLNAWNSSEDKKKISTSKSIMEENKTLYDRTPHKLFVQLDELRGVGEDREWQQQARWIKYEEDLEEGAMRFGPPHVASLSFHSLLNLRRCLETGIILMDLEEKDLPGIAYRISEQMFIEDFIHSNEKSAIMRALLMRHRHVEENFSFHFGTRNRKHSFGSLQNIGELRKRAANHEKNQRNGSIGEIKIEIKDDFMHSSQEDLKRFQQDTILRRIPGNSEASTILVGTVDFLQQPTVAFVRLAEGITIINLVEVPIPVRFFFILLGPEKAGFDYHEVGRSIATLMSNKHFREVAYKADDRKELLSAINEFLDESIVLPPGKWDKEHLLPFEDLRIKSAKISSRKLSRDFPKEIEIKEKELPIVSISLSDEKKSPDDPLEKTGRLWGGMINDLKRRLPLYKSDITDGLNTETLAATLFLYFAALSTAITFGGLSAEKTQNLIGISETLVSGCFVGMIFHLLASQPLVFVGTTGPLLLLDEALNIFCNTSGISFLIVRVYIGIWLTIIALTVSAFEGSVYVRLFTRFTQEIFSALITLIYIVETVLKLTYVYGRHPLLAKYQYLNISKAMLNQTDDMSEIPRLTYPKIVAIIGNNTGGLLIPRDYIGPLNQPNTSLLCTLLTLGTFTLAYCLKIFRNSKFLGRNARRALGDFGMPISIFIFVIIDNLMPQVFTAKLSVPNGISPSDPKQRGWQIPFGPVPIWLPLLSIVPAMLVFILIFMETHISELIVGKPERGLKKGNGLHWDIVLLCFCNTVCGLFGMPWHSAATVRSVTHVSAVTIMSTNYAPGDSPKIADIKEQRLSGFFVSLMTGVSIFAAPLLKKIPMSVLFGVFLYMGVCSMTGVQFFERLRLFFMPVKHHPQVRFVRRVPTWKMHAFTCIQVMALAVLWAVKSSKYSLAFPFFLTLMVPIRKQLERVFTPLELRALDGRQITESTEDEPDFYEQATLPA